MSARLIELFEDEKVVWKIKERLPNLFQIAELESSRAGRMGMEVGSLRERVLVALLIYKFGRENMQTEIPVIASEVDVGLFGNPVSIKTISSKGFSGIKMVWTVDTQSANDFRENYYPGCDILFVQINWGGQGGFYYIPLEAQRDLFDRIGKQGYIKLPKPGTNPRGVEFTKEAVSTLAGEDRSKRITINWQRTEVKVDPYKRWVGLWEEN